MFGLGQCCWIEEAASAQELSTQSGATISMSEQLFKGKSVVTVYDKEASDRPISKDTDGNSTVDSSGSRQSDAVPLPPPLRVPSDFSERSVAFTDEPRSSTRSCHPDGQVHRSVQGSPGSGVAPSRKDKEMLKLQKMMKDFIKDILCGVNLDIVLDDGSKESCRCQLDSALSTISLRVQDIVQTISLLDIEDVFSGSDIGHVHTTTPLDELCATLKMRSDRCVSFKFTDVRSREHFATCMKVLRLAL